MVGVPDTRGPVDSDVDRSDRSPATPEGAFDLGGAADDLLAQAADGNGRAARTLTPGAGARLKQTLLALTAGTELADHAAPGSATIQVLRGSATLRWDDTSLAVPAGHWAVIPEQQHGLHADEDTVALLTVAPRAS